MPPFFDGGETYKLYAVYVCGFIMKLEEYMGLGLYDTGFKLAKLQTCLDDEGVETRYDADNMALFVYESADGKANDLPVIEIYNDIESRDIAMLNLRPCGEWTINPYLSWLWLSLSTEQKAFMLKLLLADPDYGPNGRTCEYPAYNKGWVE